MNDTINDLVRKLDETETIADKVKLLTTLHHAIYKTDPDLAEEYARQLWQIATIDNRDEFLAYAYYTLGLSACEKDSFVNAYDYLHHACNIGERIGDKKLCAQAANVLANTYAKEGKYEEADTIYMKNLSQLQGGNDNSILAHTLHNIGAMKAKLGANIDALKYLLQALSIWEDQYDPENIVLCYNTIGGVYINMNEYNQALIFLTKAGAIIETDQHTTVQAKAQTLLNLGSVTMMLQDIETSYQYLLKAQKHYLTLKKKLMLTVVWNQLGQVCALRKEYTRALKYYTQALEIAQALGNKHREAIILGRVADLYKSQGYIDISLTKLHEARLLAIEVTDQLLLQYFCSMLSEWYGEVHDYEHALKYYKESTEIKEKILSNEKQKAVAEVQARFDVQTAEREKELFRIKNVELSAALEEVRLLNDRLTKLNHEKNEVLGVVAHDLKSPLSGVKLVSSMLKEHHRVIPEAEIDSQLDTIVQTSDRMLTIATSLIRAQALENEGVDRKIDRVDILLGITLLLDRYRDVAAQKDITLHFDKPMDDIFLHTYADGFQQIVENLLSNAIKFSPRGRSVKVAVRRSRSGLYVEIQDEGPGISSKDRKRLYGKFTRLSAQPTGGESTTGLGLWIVRKTVDAMQGSIRCISQPGKGTRFVVMVRDV